MRDAAAGSARALQRLPPPALFLVSGVSMYLGAAIAVDLFADASPRTVAWLRMVAAAVLLMVFVRPRGAAWSRSHLAAAAWFGAATAAMNVCFYLATDRVHLGSTVAIEFVGPVTVAAWSSRSRRSLAALGLAAAGVLMLGVGLRTDWLGFVYALGAGVCWGLYVVFGARVSARGVGLDGLAVGLLIGAVLSAPVGVVATSVPWGSWRVLGLCAVVAVLSTLIPYGLDQHVLRRVPRGDFALMLALLPVTATIIGRLTLAQEPRWYELVGITLVVAGVTVSARAQGREAGISPAVAADLVPD